MDSKAIQTKIQAVYQSARSVTILRTQGQDMTGSHELAVDGKDVAALKSVAALIVAEAGSPDDVFGLALKHGLIKEVR